MLQRVDLGLPAILQLVGPDAVRFLNGQITQDVRRVVGEVVSLPSCVTDAKGRLQHRVMIAGAGESALWVIGASEDAEVLEARITRYLIADDVEVTDLSGRYVLYHFIGLIGSAPEDVIAKEVERYGVPGTDWYVPEDKVVDLPEASELAGDALEAFRIVNAVPAWGKELTPGMLPPEAGLDRTDISYSKGCYIGQEVISRIKSAGKVNRLLRSFVADPEAQLEPGPIVDADGNAAGELTSVSPVAEEEVVRALGFLKRTATGESFLRAGSELRLA